MFKLRFLITLFSVSFFSDLLLNDLSRKPLSNYHNGIIIKSLESYFKNKSLIESGIYAGITVIIAYLILMLLGNGLFPSKDIVYRKFNNIPTSTLYTLLLELFLAFILGYIIDIVIDKFNIFGDSLKLYYSIAGSGFWGAIAFVFSIIVTYFILRIFYYCNLLYITSIC